MRISEIVTEDLRKWFKEKWVRFGPDGKIRGECARGSKKEGKPKCLPKAKAYALGKKKRASAAAKKRREDPNPNRKGAAKNVATKVREQHALTVYESLSSLVNQDQAERNEYSQFVKSQADGDWSRGAKMYAQSKNRSSDDIFGEKERLQQFMKMKFDFDKFNDSDWDDYWLLSQHCDSDRTFQKHALATIKKYQGKDHKNYQYLYDRISCGLTGSQRYGTQNVCKIDADS